MDELVIPNLHLLRAVEYFESELRRANVRVVWQSKFFAALCLALPYYLAGMLVVANTEKSRMAKLVVFGPLDETNLDNDRGLNPVRAQAW